MVDHKGTWKVNQTNITTRQQTNNKQQQNKESMRYKRRASVQLQNFEFSIEPVLDHEECLSVFEKYLESTHTV